VETVGVVLIAVAGALVLVGVGLEFASRLRVRKAVDARSTALAALRALNLAYRNRLISYGPINRLYFDQVSSKAKFDRFDLAELLRDCLDRDEIALATEIEQRKSSMRAFVEYESERFGIQTEQLGKTDFGNLKRERCLRAEVRLFDRQRLRLPPPTAHVVCGVGYDSPQGRNSYRKSFTLSFDELEQALQEMRAYRSIRNSAAERRRVERSKMTASVRVDVLRRDGYRCRFCGAGSGVAELHVDHIVPVSKGGLTELDNLQTLCADCNQGKSNRFAE
jgi:hypothetical protein